MEQWKDIKNYDNYMVSNLGRVKSLNYNRTGKERVLKPSKDKDGYLIVGLYKNGKGKTHKIHRLVAETFIPNPENKPCIDHINTDKTDNRVENLRFVTQYENMNNEISKKKMSEAKQGKYDGENNPMFGRTGENHPRGMLGKHHTEETKAKIGRKVLCVETGKTYPTSKQASEELNISRSSISNHLHGRSKSCGGYHFIYVD